MIYLQPVFTAIFIFSSVLLWSQPLLESPDLDQYLLSGHRAVATGSIVNSTPKKLEEITVTAHVVQMGSESQRTEVVELDEEGRFRIEVESPYTYQQIWLSITNLYFGQLMLHDGLDLVIDAARVKKKGEHFDSPAISFQGPDGPLNKQLNRFTSYWQRSAREEMDQIGDIKMSHTLPASRKVQLLDSLYNRRFEIIDDYLAKHGSEFGEILKNEEMSDYLGDLAISYLNETMPDDRLQQVLEHIPCCVSNAGHGYYNGLGFLTYPNQLDSESNLKEIVKQQRSSSRDASRIDSFMLLGPKDKGYRRHFQYFHKLNEAEFEEATWRTRKRKFAALGPRKADVVKLVQVPDDPTRAAEFAEHMLPTIEVDWVHDKVAQAEEKARQALRDIEESLAAAVEDSIGMAAGANPILLPNGARLAEAVGEDAATFVNALKKQFSNKTIILDVWATWCGPCIRDMQESKESVAQLSREDVEVVYLCASRSSTRKQWKRKVAELDLPAWHYHLDPNLSGQLMEMFELGGYPSHVVLLPDGSINKSAIHQIRGLTAEKLQEALK